MFIEQRKQSEAKSQRESYKSRWRGEAGNFVSSCLGVRKMRPGHGYCSEDEDGFECRKGRKLINPETSALSFEANRTDWTGAREKKEGLEWRMKRGMRKRMGQETKRRVVELGPGRDFGPWDSGEGGPCTAHLTSARCGRRQYLSTYRLLLGCSAVRWVDWGTTSPHWRAGNTVEPLSGAADTRQD